MDTKPASASFTHRDEKFLIGVLKLTKKLLPQEEFKQFTALLRGVPFATSAHLLRSLPDSLCVQKHRPG